jgi:hypothetical protein
MTSAELPFLISSDDSDAYADMPLLISDSDDSDGPISRGARRLAIQLAQDRVRTLNAALPMQRRLENVTIPQPQSQLNPNNVHRQTPPVPRSPEVTTASPIITSPPLHLSPSIIRKRIRITDSDCNEATTASPIIRSPPPHHSPSIIRKRIQIDDSDCDEATTASPLIRPPPESTETPLCPPPFPLASVPLLQAARIKMHEYFARFQGCNPARLEVEQVSAPDADLLDLRSAVPPRMPLQFLLLESEHVPTHSNDTSGETDSQSASDMDSFCDDGYYSDTPEQISFRESEAEWMARRLPITAAALKTKTSNSQPIPPRRQRIVLSESPPPTQKISE